VSATVERTAGDGIWEPIGSVLADGTGRLGFVDRDVVAGGRYGYRLAYLDAGVVTTAGEAWVDVPADLALALEGLRPNPATGELTVGFTLASREAARLELLDVAGRRLLVRELDGPAPGRHTLRLDGARPPAGVYFLRLTQAGGTVSARAAITR